jgi:hypothetical protein
MQNRARRFFAGTIIFTAVACGRSSAGSSPSPDISASPPTESARPVLSGATSWKLQPSNAERFYSTISDTHLKLSDSSTATNDGITSRAEFTISSSRATPTWMISATINTFSLEGGSRSGVSNTAFSLPFSIAGRFQNNKLIFTPAGGSAIIDCTNPVLSTLPVIQRAVIAPPSQLYAGTTWNDSTTVELCSGGIPVTAITNRNYQVLGEAVIGSVPVILLERHDRSSSAGEGSSGQHRITLRTETVGSGQVAIDRLTGSLIDDVSTYTTSITIRASGRNQQFTQIVKEHTSLRR